MSQAPHSGLTIYHAWRHIPSETDSVVCQELYRKELLIGKCGCLAQTEIWTWTSRDFTQNKLNSSVITVKETEPRNLCARPAPVPAGRRVGLGRGCSRCWSGEHKAPGSSDPHGICHYCLGLRPIGHHLSLIQLSPTPSATILWSPNNNSKQLFSTDCLPDTVPDALHVSSRVILPTLLWSITIDQVGQPQERCMEKCKSLSIMKRDFFLSLLPPPLTCDGVE